MLNSLSRFLRYIKGDGYRPIDVVKEGKWTEDTISVHYIVIKLGKPIPIVKK